MREWKFDEEFPWRLPADQFPPAVSCDDSFIACGLRNPLSPDAVAERLDEMFQDSIWWGGRKSSAEEEATDDVKGSQIRASPGAAMGQEV